MGRGKGAALADMGSWNRVRGGKGGRVAWGEEETGIRPVPMLVRLLPCVLMLARVARALLRARRIARPI